MTDTYIDKNISSSKLNPERLHEHTELKQTQWTEVKKEIHTYKFVETTGKGDGSSWWKQLTRIKNTGCQSAHINLQSI